MADKLLSLLLLLREYIAEWQKKLYFQQVIIQFTSKITKKLEAMQHISLSNSV